MATPSATVFHCPRQPQVQRFADNAARKSQLPPAQIVAQPVRHRENLLREREASTAHGLCRGSRRPGPGWRPRALLAAPDLLVRITADLGTLGWVGRRADPHPALPRLYQPLAAYPALVRLARHPRPPDALAWVGPDRRPDPARRPPWWPTASPMRSWLRLMIAPCAIACSWWTRQRRCGRTLPLPCGCSTSAAASGGPPWRVPLVGWAKPEDLVAVLAAAGPRGDRCPLPWLAS